jgi:hypothetical protein
VITVPASFDIAAQRLTLAAAEEAKFPNPVQLLEEPQAAFYAWLEQHDIAKELWCRLSNLTTHLYHVLVVDIGGGTSDFSLFELSHGNTDDYIPNIQRIAVSDHILLGGDNIDLAIANLFESKLVDRTKLSSVQWNWLVTYARNLKEKILSEDGPSEQSFLVSIPKRGSDLLKGVLTAQVTRAEIEEILLNGFFPKCQRDDQPLHTLGGLKEWGLPYAADSAITKHLASFLRDRPYVDAVLFNGGSLYPKVLKERLCQLIGEWQGRVLPIPLENTDPDLAVARGAARFGVLLQHRVRWVKAGAPSAVFLEAHWLRDGRTKPQRSLVCILPRGAGYEQEFSIINLNLELQVNRLVQFQSWYSTFDNSSQVGTVVNYSVQGLHSLPSLEVFAKVEGEIGATSHTVPVTLTTRLNELGLLQVLCVSTDPRIPQSWPLTFNLRLCRPDTNSSVTPSEIETKRTFLSSSLSSSAYYLEDACMTLKSLFSKRTKPKEKFTAARILKSLEKSVGLARMEWNLILVRSLWTALESCVDSRQLSAEHEEVWLMLAGFLLRPGFGAAMDDIRIDSLWRLCWTSAQPSSKRTRLQEYILWRRVAGGLKRERQEEIFATRCTRLLQQDKPPSELIHLVGALERLDLDTKVVLIDMFILKVVDLVQSSQHCAPWLVALGLLLNRTPLYAGIDSVVVPDLVEKAWQAFAGFNWTSPELLELQTLFLRAARAIDNRNFDVPKGLRQKIASKLEKCGVSPRKIGRVRDFTPIARSEQVSLYGEALPPGLILGRTQNILTS